MKETLKQKIQKVIDDYFDSRELAKQIEKVVRAQERILKKKIKELLHKVNDLEDENDILRGQNDELEDKVLDLGEELEIMDKREQNS